MYCTKDIRICIDIHIVLLLKLGCHMVNVCVYVCMRVWTGVCVCMFVCVCVITLSSVHTFYDYRYIRIYVVPLTLLKFLQKFKDKIFKAQLVIINLKTIENFKTGVFIKPGACRL